MVLFQGVNISWHSHFQMLQSAAGKETFQYFSLSVTSLWGSWDAEDADGRSKQLQKQWSACRWPCASMWSTRSEVRCYVRLSWINMLVSLCVCVWAQMGSCMVFFYWRCLLWFSLVLVCHQMESTAHRFICCYFLKKLCYLQYSSGPCMLQWHNSLSKSTQKDDVAPCCWCSCWVLSLGTWALAKGPLCTCP